MNNAIAKKLHDLAEAKTIGKSKDVTKEVYKNLKRAYKPYYGSRKDIPAQSTEAIELAKAEAKRRAKTVA